VHRPDEEGHAAVLVLDQPRVRLPAHHNHNMMPFQIISVCPQVSLRARST
jgi:hypothetical protein